MGIDSGIHQKLLSELIFFLSLTLDLPVTERTEGTLVTTVLAVLSGCAFVRVHDIKENRRAIHRMICHKFRYKMSQFSIMNGFCQIIV